MTAVPGRAHRVITVGVLTFHRPGPLARLLPMLLDEASRHESDPCGPGALRDHVGVVVVDNDPLGSARWVVAELGAQTPRDLRYVVEVRKGISAARNRVLREAEGSDLLVFIDDDETPEPGWLSSLVRTHDTSGADAVAGPVVSRFSGELDPWVSAGGYFDREHHRGRPEGSLMRSAASNNLLLNLHTVRRLGLHFDDAYGLSGGEDTLFTSLLTRAGAEIRWSAEAVVLDHLPAPRLTRAYALRRTYDLANSSTRVSLKLAELGVPRHRRRAKLTGEAVARLGLGVLRSGFGRISGSEVDHSRGSRSIARGRGALAAVLGKHSSSYGLPGGESGNGGASPQTIWVAHPSSDLYGSDLQLVETVRGLREAGHHVAVLLPTEGALTSRFTELGAQVAIVPAPILRKALLSPMGLMRFTAELTASAWRLRGLMRDSQPAALVVNTVTIPSWLVAGRWAGVPTLCHVHEAEADQPLPIRVALAMPLILAQRVVTNSRASSQVICGALPFLKAKTTLVYNGLAGPNRPAAVRHRQPGDPLHLVLVGRLSPRKGIDIALEALARLRAAGVDASLTLCGSTFPGYEWYEEQLRTRVASADLAGHVTLLGYVASPAPELDSADIVLVPSRVEPFGNAAVEALLAERPLVASRTQGLCEIVHSGDTGLLVTPGDVTELADAIQSLASRPDEAAEMAHRGLVDARERFSVERYRRDMTAHVEALIVSPAGRRRTSHNGPR